MTTEEIKIRIAKKEQEVSKLERLYNKYASENLEEKAIIDRFLETGNRDEYREYLKAHNMWWGGDAWHKAGELYEARNTLAKYQKQLETAQDKENTINEMPEVLVEFKNNLIERWDRYDEWKKQTIREKYNNFDYSNQEERRTFYSEMRETWGQGWYEFMYMTTEQIHKANVQAAETIVLNLLNRTVELTGKITDCKCLRIDVDNQGYSIINGIVIGEKGKARVESIGAGGYNIQRYHIRVLVKEVRD